MSLPVRTLINDMQGRLHSLSEDMIALDEMAERLLSQASGVPSHSWSLYLTILVLACFVGYYVVWQVTPALHSPLMAVTNAISSVVIVGAMMALGHENASPMTRILGFVGVFAASVNIFGGFVVTERMLKMFKKKE